MTTDKTIQTVTLTMASADLLNMLGNTIPFSSKDDTLPALQHLWIEPTDDGRITSHSTDRYRLARVEMPLIRHTGDLASHQLLLPRSLAESFVKALKGLKRELKRASDWNVASRGEMPESALATLTADLEVTESPFDHRHATVTKTSWRLEFQGGSLSGETTQQPEFLKIRSLYTEPNADDSHGIFAVLPSLLADFAKVKDLAPGSARNLPIRFAAGSAGKPIALQFDDWFEGIIMPVRLPEQVAHSSRAA